MENIQSILPQTLHDIKQVLATIIVTHYNYSNFVESALRSLLVQNHTKFECVIVDDCSERRHIEKLRSIVDSLGDSRLKVLALTENLGQTNAVFEGLAQSSGEFVAILDPDDVYEPNFISKMLQCHLNPCVYAAVAACEMGLFRVGGSVLTRNYTGFKARAIRNKELGIFEASQMDFGFSTYYPPETPGWLWGTTTSMMFRRDALNVLRRETYMQNTKICADTYCVYGSHLLGGTLFLDEMLCWRGIHSGNAVESSSVLAISQKRHQPAFIDTSKAIKFFAAQTILANDGVVNLKDEALIKTLKVHFTPEELDALIVDSTHLQKVLFRNFTAFKANTLEPIEATVE